MDEDPWVRIVLPPMIKIEMSDTVTHDSSCRPHSNNVTLDVSNAIESKAGQQDPSVSQTAPILRLPEEVLMIIVSLAMDRSEYSYLPFKKLNRETRRWQRELHDLRVESSMDRNRDQFPVKQPYKKRLNSDPLRLLLVCKAFYFAGVQQYYGSNTIHFDTAQELVDFANDLGSDRSRYVRNVSVDMLWEKGDNAEYSDESWLSIYHNVSRWICISLPQDYARLCSEHLKETLPRLSQVTIDLNNGFRAANVRESAKDSIESKIFEALARKKFMGRECEFKLVT